MKTSFLLYLSALSLSCLLYACSGSQYASRYQEHDDMYFTRADRTETERFASNSKNYLSSGYGQSKEAQQRNYSSAYQSNPTFRPNNKNSNSNPDYYPQDGIYDDSTDAIVEYYRDNYVGFNNQNPTSGTFQGDNWNYQAPQYNMHMGMSPWGNNFGWQMGMPLSNNFWMGFGSGWGNGFYDPWGWNSPWGMNAWNRPWGWNSWYRPRGWNAWGWHQPTFWGGEPVRRVVYRPRGSNLSSGSTMFNNPQNNNTSYNVQNASRQRTYATGSRNGQTGSTSAVSNSGRTRNRTSNNYTMGGNETYQRSTSGSYNNNTQQRRSGSGMFYNNNQSNNSNRQNSSSSYQNNSNNNSSSYYGSGSSGRSRTSSSSSGSSGYRSSGSSGGGRSGGGRSRP